MERAPLHRRPPAPPGLRAPGARQAIPAGAAAPRRGASTRAAHRGGAAESWWLLLLASGLLLVTTPAPGCLGGGGPARPGAGAGGASDGGPDGSGPNDAALRADLDPAGSADLDVSPAPDAGSPPDPDLGAAPGDDLGFSPDLGPPPDPDLGPPPDPDLGPPPDPDLGPPPDPDAGGPDCPEGVICLTAADLPFERALDTRQAGRAELDHYACQPGTDESGPELLVRVALPSAGFLSAAVFEQDGVDADVHLLSALDPAACLARGNYAAGAEVGPGTAWVVADTFVAGGVPQVGAFRLRIGLVLPSVGPCTMQHGTMPRVGDGGQALAMPATGPVALEAHLVTQAEAYRPSSAREHLDEHYQLSEAATGLVLHRRQDWAPLEGGDFYGCGIGSPTVFPVLDEAWYVNMYWTSQARPARGTRMILRQPDGGPRAVVVAAGYETGPGDLDVVGGTPEESHFFLGTGHRSVLTLGLALDGGLPLGPRICTD